MLTSTGPGAISPVTPSKIYYVSQEREVSAQTVQAGKYDSVTLSASQRGENRKFMDIVSRLSQEVRTATTTGDIQTLRQQVTSGQYMPDPMNIAARMLMLGDEQ